MSKASDWTASRPRMFVGNKDPVIEASVTLRGYCMITSNDGREVAIHGDDVASLARWMLDTFGN